MTDVDVAGDEQARTARQLLEDAFGPAVAERILLGEHDPDRRLARRIYRLLEDRGGDATHPHLVRYLATLLAEPADHVRNVLLEEVHAGTLHIASDPRDPRRHTVRIVKP